MGQLGDVLEVLFGPDDRFHTVRATIRHWLNHDLARKVDGKGRSGVWPQEGRRRKRTRSAEVLHFHPDDLAQPAGICPDRRAPRGRRRPRDQAHRDRRRPPLGMRLRGPCGGERGRASESEGVRLRRHRHQRGPSFQPSTDPALLQELTLESLGLVRTAGRDCVRLRAVLRPGARSLWPHWLPKEADEYEFHVDPSGVSF